MMDASLYRMILQCGPNAGPDEIKKAYHRLARANHPDFFPEECRPIQEMKMKEINIAYDFLLNEAERLRETAPGKGFRESPQKNEPDLSDELRLDLKKEDVELSPSREIGPHGDPAYAYYKQGFINFSKGLNGIMSKRPLKIKKSTYHISNWASESLRCFHSAHGYFSRVVEEYPGSIWCFDAREKLARIENFNELYRRILLNVKQKASRSMHK